MFRSFDWRGRISRPAASAKTSTALETQGPTAPTRFSVFDDYCGDVFLVWNPSSDDRDPSSALTYEIYVNGDLAHTVVGRTWAAFETLSEGQTSFAVVAVDTAGNASAASAYSINLDPGCD